MALAKKKKIFPWIDNVAVESEKEESIHVHFLIMKILLFLTIQISVVTKQNVKCDFKFLSAFLTYEGYCIKSNTAGAG